MNIAFEITVKEANFILNILDSSTRDLYAEFSRHHHTEEEIERMWEQARMCAALASRLRNITPTKT